jgi:hypothetical protein
MNQDYLDNLWDERKKKYVDNISAIHIIRNEARLQVEAK